MYGMNVDQFSEGGVMGAPLEQFNPWAQSLAMANRQQMQQPMGKPGLLSPMPSLAMPGLAGMTPPAGVPVKPGSLGNLSEGAPIGMGALMPKPQPGPPVYRPEITPEMIARDQQIQQEMAGGGNNLERVGNTYAGRAATAEQLATLARANTQAGSPVSSNMPDAAQAMMNLFGQGGDRQGGANQFRKPLRQRGGPFNFLGGFQF